MTKRSSGVVSAAAAAAASQDANATWEALRLTHLKPSFNSQELALAARQDLWHKFIIFDAGSYENETVMDAVITACRPEVILPVMYKIEDSRNATFLSKCSIAVIESLVRQGLQICLLDNRILKMDIILGFISMNELQVNPHKLITEVLVSRWDSLKKVLNLDNFKTDKGLGSMYCPLSLPTVFVFVMRCARMRIGNSREKFESTRLPVRELNLKNNKLAGVMLYEKALNYTLTKLDLSFNKIENVEFLRYFSEFKITELWLDGNPLCTIYKSPEEYIQAVRKVFPHVQKLDGVIIDIEHKQPIPVNQPCFLLDNSRLSLVKQFVRHYFTLFDQKDRSVLNGLYDANAYFSTTVGHIANPRHRQLTKIMAINRNFLKLVDYSRGYKYLLQGPDQIINTLRRLPPTHHDYKSFAIDLLHQGDHHLVMSIQGTFFYREFPISLNFARTFIIIEKDDHEYRIVNDQYHIQSGNSTIIESDVSKMALNRVPPFEPTYLSANEKDDLLKFLCNVTTMNTQFSEQFLERNNWDLRAAIGAFRKAYTVNDVPPEAFKSLY
ncbi:nuclear RNA export factor 1-like [Diachasmimorpha longicaudata]|uniref:nuclear RNA export factor 1-like n=1 Tax=Diachasmimorpha longicaudata TaxID=58733 RepID=UPI0030B8FF7F